MKSWTEDLRRLASEDVALDELPKLIVRLGKPFDKQLIEQAAATVANFITHPSAQVRHEAIWFLGCWGRLAAYLPLLAEAIEKDDDAWNRAYAARCVGSLAKLNDRAVTAVLLRSVRDHHQEEEVRLSSYGALLVQQLGPEEEKLADEFQLWHSKTLADVSEEWLSKVEEGLR